MIRQFIGQTFRAMWYVIDYLDTLPTYKIVAVVIGLGIMASGIAVIINYLFRRARLCQQSAKNKGVL